MPKNMLVADDGDVLLFATNHFKWGWNECCDIIRTLYNHANSEIYKSDWMHGEYHVEDIRLLYIIKAFCEHHKVNSFYFAGHT